MNTKATIYGCAYHVNRVKAQISYSMSIWKVLIDIKQTDRMKTYICKR